MSRRPLTGKLPFYAALAQAMDMSRIVSHKMHTDFKKRYELRFDSTSNSLEMRNADSKGHEVSSTRRQ